MRPELNFLSDTATPVEDDLFDSVVALGDRAQLEHAAEALLVLGSNRRGYLTNTMGRQPSVHRSAVRDLHGYAARLCTFQNRDCRGAPTRDVS